MNVATLITKLQAVDNKNATVVVRCFEDEDKARKVMAKDEPRYCKGDSVEDIYDDGIGDYIVISA